MSGYAKSFNEVKYMSFLINDDELLEKYCTIKHGIKSAMILKKDLVVNQYTTKNI